MCFNFYRSQHGKENIVHSHVHDYQGSCQYFNNLVSLFLTYTCQFSEKLSHWESVARAA